MARRAIVLAGLVRAPDRFRDFLKEALPFAADAGIEVIFSTWKGELDKYPEVAEILKGSRCTIISQDEPDLVVHGHVVHQIVSLDAGLSLLDDNVFAQRLRPDFATIRDMQAFMRHEPEPLPDTIRLRHPFRHRLYVSGCTLAHPLYINDICFAGMVGDLRQITATPVTYWIKYTRLAPEQLIWGSPTMWFNPLFDSYFRANVGLIFNDAENTAGSIETMKASPLYRKALAAYFHFLAQAFTNIMGDADPDEMATACRRHTLEDILWATTDLPWTKIHPPSLTTHASDVSIARTLAAGNFRETEFGSQVLEALRELESGAPQLVVSRAEKDELTAESCQLADAFDRATNVHGFRIFRASGNERTIGGIRPHWRVIGERSARETELENEVNQLRRVVDSLVNRLRRGETAGSDETVAPSPEPEEKPAHPVETADSDVTGPPVASATPRSLLEAGAVGLVADVFRCEELLGAQPDLILKGFTESDEWYSWLRVRPWLTARFYIDACIRQANVHGVSSHWFGPASPVAIAPVSTGSSLPGAVTQLDRSARCLLDLTAALRMTTDASSVRIYAPEALSEWILALRGRYPRFTGSEPEDRHPADGDTFPIQLQNPHRLSYPDGSFDLVLARDPGSQPSDIGARFHQFGRILRPGGVLLASIPEAPGEASAEPPWPWAKFARDAGFGQSELLFYSTKKGGMVTQTLGGVWVLLAIR